MLGSLFSYPMISFSSRRQDGKGWLDDAALMVNEALYNFDLIKLYMSFVESIVNAQGADGAVLSPRLFSNCIANRQT
jgi:hypothetical protein